MAALRLPRFPAAGAPNTCLLYTSADNSSTTVDGEEQSRNRPGVNVLVYDKVLDRVIQSISFSTLHAYSGYTA